MPTLTFTTEIAASQEALFAFHDGTEALTKITPPGTRVRLIDAPAKLTQGVVFTLVVSQPPVFVPLRWRCEFLIWEPPLRFVDRQVPGSGPFAFWEHEHRFEALDAKRSQLTDTITYTPPFGPLGKLADALFIRKQLTEMFAYRHRVTKAALEGV
ncbi:MAG: SRPBCC family protein [Armatimonadetes bacterium]|nr:SRPBCC family protein [Armatimonadota bacterium]